MSARVQNFVIPGRKANPEGREVVMGVEGCLPSREIPHLRSASCGMTTLWVSKGAI